MAEDSQRDLERALALALAEIETLRDEVDAARAARLQLRVAARTDHLTNVGTRAFFLEQLDLALAGSSNQRPVVLMVDIDQFKAVNDTHGHQVGDEVLVHIAARLRQAVGNNGIVSRFGGDEFAMLLYHDDDLTTAIREISYACQQPIPSGTTSITPQITIGAVVWDGNADEAHMLRYADLAMYEARGSREQAALFDWARTGELEVERTISDDLLSAIGNDLLRLAFQPIVNLESGHVVALEVLTRWSHSVHGEVSPDVFIGIAERTQLIGHLDRRIIERAVQWFGSTPGISPTVDLSINVSPLSLVAPFARRLQETVETSGVDPSRLTLEVTETASVRDLKVVQATLRDLADLGIKIALDDFGTGYSSLTYVHDLPIRELKIDRSFVMTMLDNRKSRELVRAIIHVAKALDLRLVAEGIETREHATLLKNMGCTLGQGYYFTRPLDDQAVLDALTVRLPHNLRRQAVQDLADA